MYRSLYSNLLSLKYLIIFYTIGNFTQKSVLPVIEITVAQWLRYGTGDHESVGSNPDNCILLTGTQS